MTSKEEVLNNYEIIKQIGEGGYGKALLGKSKSNGNLFVIKIVSLEYMDDDNEQKAVNEGNILRKLTKNIQHENIVKFYGSYLFEGEAVLIMEYVEGGQLRDKMEEEKLWRRKIDEKTIVTWLKEIASALKYCHEKNIAHRDLKPENILLTKDNHVKLADFGVAKMFSKKVKVTQTKVTDLDYISPEMEAEEPYTYSTDIWSLGVIIYELCLLKHPQDKYRLNKMQFLSGEIPKLEDKDYSQKLSDLIAKMLSVEPTERPTTDEIIKICESILQKGDSPYQGEMVNGLREGKGTYSFANGDKYEGDWKSNKMEGKGVYTYKDGDKYDGEWVGGKKKGQGIYYFSDGKRYEGNWVQSKMEGKGIFYYANGDKYDGEWKNSKREGKGTYYYSNGCKYEGEWKDGKKEGNGTLHIIKKGIWKNNEYQDN